MSSAAFFKEAKKINLRLSPNKDTSDFAPSLDNEALFQLPLLAMTILAISKGNSKPKLQEIGQLVGECLERTVAGFKGSSQDIGWSGNLRVRTIKALSFLELTNQVSVDKHSRSISATKLGKKVYEDAVDGDTLLAVSMRTIEVSYQYLRDEARMRGEVN